MGTSSRSRTACSRRPVRPAAAAVSIRVSVWQWTPSDARASLFSMLTTNQKGTVAETGVLHEAAKLGIAVYRSIGDERCDFVFDLAGRLVRVQCKWAARRRDVLVVPLYSARRTADGLRRTFYAPSDVDAFAAYSLDTGCCYYLSMAIIEGLQAVSLRLDRPRNNQA